MHICAEVQLVTHSPFPIYKILSEVQEYVAEDDSEIVEGGVFQSPVHYLEVLALFCLHQRYVQRREANVILRTAKADNVDDDSTLIALSLFIY